MTQNTDDELICAYIDNQLSPVDRQTFQSRLQESAQLRARLAQFESVDAACLAAVDNAIDSPIPDKVSELLKPKSAKSSVFVKGLGLAASLAVISLALVFIYTDRPAQDLQYVIQQTLERTPSTKTSSLGTANNTQMYIHLSFRHKDGRFCREYSVLDEHSATRNIACKSSTWEVLLTKQDRVALVQPQFQLASEARPAEIENFLDTNMQGDGLNEQQEQIKITQGWQ